MKELLYKRRSTRQFTEWKVEKDKVESLLEAGLLAPTSRNLYSWMFIAVDDPAKLQELSAAKAHGSGFLAGAPLGIVVLADPHISDVWIEDTAIASSFMTLRAETLGLGSCWIQIRNRYRDQEQTFSSEEHVRQVLEIPEELKVASILAVGYKAEQRASKTPDDLYWDKFRYNRYDIGWKE